MDIELFLLKTYSLTLGDVNNMTLLDFDYFYNKTVRDIEVAKQKRKEATSGFKSPFSILTENNG